MKISPNKFDVLTIGHALVDVLAVSDDAFIVSQGMTKGAMHLIDAIRAEALYSKMGPASEVSGGSAANTAAGVVICGGSAAFIGTVGKDLFGDIFTHDIRAAGVHYVTDQIERTQTGHSLILITPDGERTMNTHIGISSQVSVDHLDDALLSSSAITYVEGYLLDDFHPFETWEAIAKKVHSAGNLFSITLSDPYCVTRHRQLFLNLLDGSVDICFGNEEELCMLFEVDDFEVALSMIAKRCEIAAITRGALGSVIVSADQKVNVQPVPVMVHDTTGAGDLYAAGVLTGLAKGLSLEQCGSFGAQAASAVLGVTGARLGSEVSITHD